MKRRLVVWFALVAAALVVTASPASAVTASTNTTDADFQAATTLDSVSVADGAVSMDATSTTSTVTRPEGSQAGSQQNDRRGARIELKGSASEIEVGVSSLSEATTVYLTDTAGNVIESESISSNSATFTSDISSGTYYITADDGGSYYHPEQKSGSYPYTSDLVDITGGVYNGDTAITSNVYNILSVDVTAGDAVYVSSTHSLSDVEGAVADLELTDAQANVTLLGDGDGDGTFETTVFEESYTTSGRKSAQVDEPGVSEFRMEVVFTPTGSSASAELLEEGVFANAKSPDLSNSDPVDGTKTTSFSGNVSINVTDPDFGSSGGDTVTVTATNSSGGEIGSTTVSANTTVSFGYDPLAGENTVTWEAADAYGTSDTYQQTFSTPATLKLRTETNPSEPITSSGSAEVTFFGDTTVETREITNGTADLSGLPADETFVAVVSLDGFYQRRILIPSLFEQQTVYLLNESVSAVDVEFYLDDSTGQFSNGDVELTVDKAIVVNNSTEFRTVVGDRISASGGLPASLEQGARYRIAVSKDGNTRSLGSYTASNSGIVELPIGRVELSGDFDEGWTLEHSIDDTEQGDVLRLKYVDKEGSTSSIETTVVRLNDSGGVVETVLPNATETDTQSVVRSTVVNNSTDTFAVRYTIERDGETISGERRLGELEGVTLPVDAGWLNLISWVSVFGFGGLIVIKDSRAAGLVMAGSASLFSMLGWLQAPTAVLALSAAAAVVWAVAGSGGGY